MGSWIGKVEKEVILEYADIWGKTDSGGVGR
jgi:hypothetical protein